jgi:hypothetical protein
MSFELPPVGGPQQTTPPQRVPAPGDAASAQALGAAVEVDVSIPSSPPSELYKEMAAASRRVDELAAEGRELHFSSEEDTGRIIVEVRDLEGNVIRTIPPSKMLEIMSGGKLEI